MKQQRILILGSGGRECALAWKIAQSAHCEKLFIAPGNAGTSHYGTNVDLTITDFVAIKDFCLKEEVTILIPAPEEPLVKGIYDYFLASKEVEDVLVVGPSKAGAVLEGSKDFSKKFMQRHGIPTAAYQSFNLQQIAEGISYLQNHKTPIVLKADGLAAGKGVVIEVSSEAAVATFKAMLEEGKFGDAGNTVVVEQFLEGVELSVFVLCNGNDYCLLPEAKDYKRVGEGDTGLNTGGMGAISPAPFADDSFMKMVEDRIIKPTLNGLVTEGIHYQGFLFFGLIKVGEQPMVIEYNCRMGDPETEVVLPRLQNDLVELFLAMKAGTLSKERIIFSEQAAATVMMVSGGYPGAYETGKEISGLELATGSMLFHAGTTSHDGKVLTNGGRVLAVTALGADLNEATTHCIASANKIEFEGKNFRTDIGFEFL